MEGHILCVIISIRRSQKVILTPNVHFCVPCPIKAWHSFVECHVGWLSAYIQSSVKVRSPEVSLDIHFSTHVPPKRPNRTWESLFKFLLVRVGAECVVSITQHRKDVSPPFFFHPNQRKKENRKNKVSFPDCSRTHCVQKGVGVDLWQFNSELCKASWRTLHWEWKH